MIQSPASRTVADTVGLAPLPPVESTVLIDCAVFVISTAIAWQVLLSLKKVDKERRSILHALAVPFVGFASVQILIALYSRVSPPSSGYSLAPLFVAVFVILPVSCIVSALIARRLYGMGLMRSFWLVVAAFIPGILISFFLAPGLSRLWR